MGLYAANFPKTRLRCTLRQFLRDFQGGAHGVIDSASLKLSQGKKFQLVGTPLGKEFKELSGE